MWDDHTALMAFGTTMWGLNRAAYGFGYWGYENPYYTEPYPIEGGVPLDYSQPMIVESAPAEQPATPSDAPVPGMSDFDAARACFLSGGLCGGAGLDEQGPGCAAQRPDHPRVSGPGDVRARQIQGSGGRAL